MYGFGTEEELCFHCPAFYLQLAFFFPLQLKPLTKGKE